MRKPLIIIRYRTSADWSSIKVKAKESITLAIEELYTVITNNAKVGDISIDGVMHTASEVKSLYGELKG